MSTAGRRRCAATSKVNQPPLRRWGCAQIRNGRPIAWRSLRGELGWQHQYGKLERKTQLMFKRTDAAFDVNSVPVSRDGAVLKAGVDVAVNKTPSCPSATAGGYRQTTRITASTPV